VAVPTPLDNHLLAALPPDVRERLFPRLELMSLVPGTVLYESGETLNHVYFPTDSVVSLLYLMENGASGDISAVGNNGVLGIAEFLGGDSTSSQALVQSAGSAYRLPALLLKNEFHRNRELQHLLLRYTQSLINQMAQNVVCNRHHSVDQQLCRLLLQFLDRLSSNKLAMTHEMVASMLAP
jgi:CRP-like cAMP-binding protein